MNNQRKKDEDLLLGNSSGATSKMEEEIDIVYDLIADTHVDMLSYIII